jgi:hypothetical protein
MDIASIKKVLVNFISSDSAGIVIDMLFHKCRMCKIHIPDVFCVDFYLGGVICNFCKSKEPYRICKNCRKVYPLLIFNWCNLCNGNCRMFCGLHLKEECKIPYTSYPYAYNFYPYDYVIDDTDSGDGGDELHFNNRYY